MVVLLLALFLPPAVIYPHAAVQNVVQNALVPHQREPLVEPGASGHGQHQVLLPAGGILPGSHGQEGVVPFLLRVPES